MLNAGDLIELTIEKPAVGGRMLARHDGRVVFVHGAIPGERVRARLERIERQLAFASAAEIIDASADRRESIADLSCGGCSYAHVVYSRQLALKSEVIHDTFARLGRILLDEPVVVEPSPERGYRMRARFHVKGTGIFSGRLTEKMPVPLSIGFYREGTHEVCDARQTGQLLDESVDAATSAIAAAAAVAAVASAVVSENLAADQRVLHFEGPSETVLSSPALDAAMRAGALTGCSAAFSGRSASVGTPTVSDPLPALTGGRAPSGVLQRHAESFFQANRYLLPHLVRAVLQSVLPDGDVVDLYAGVGLFSVSLAHTGRDRITAVEGDRRSARDLAANAAACNASIRVVAGSVEEYLSTTPAPQAATIVVDPPRTGISRAAMEAVVRKRAARVLYVSCDPATMARDARRLLDGGYRLGALRAFDLFPNTPHVETVGIFDRT